jgi:hypothetical protein
LFDTSFPLINHTTLAFGTASMMHSNLALSSFFIGSKASGTLTNTGDPINSSQQL